MPLTGLNSTQFMPFQCKNLDFQRHVLYVQWSYIVCFADIERFVVHHSLNILFTTIKHPTHILLGLNRYHHSKYSGRL